MTKKDSKRYLTESHIIKNKDWINKLDEISFKTKNLYNLIMYFYRQCFSYFKGSEHEDVIKTVEYLNEKITKYNKASNSKDLKMITRTSWMLSANFLQWLMTNDFESGEYEHPKKSLNATTAKFTIKMVCDNWMGYVKSCKSYNKNSSNFTGRPKPPNYKHKEKGRVEIRTRERKVKIDGTVELYEDSPIRIKTILPPKTIIKMMQARPFGKYYQITLIYENNNIKPNKEKKNRMIGIDLGVDRFATLQNNFGEESIAINGKGIKSYNQLYNKKLAHYKSIAARLNNKKSTDRIMSLHHKRNMRMNDFLHNASRYIVNYCIEKDVDTVVVGKTKGWKDNSKMSKKNNQNFIQIPHAKFIEKLRYKLENEGIELIEKEESYTSKASFLDNDHIPTYEKGKSGTYEFSGRRMQRAFYKASDGTKLHADVNGASNILRKSFPEAFNDVEDISFHPRIVNVVSYGKKNNTKDLVGV